MLLRLLGLSPYIASIVAFYSRHRRMFREDDQPSAGWKWDTVSPLLIAALTPLVASANASLSSNRRTALIAISASTVLVVICFGLLVDTKRFFTMTLPIGYRRWALPATGEQLMLAMGLMLIAGCGAGTFLVTK